LLVGSVEQVIDKFGRYHEAFGHELSGIALGTPGFPEVEQKASVETFVTEVMPVLRATGLLLTSSPGREQCKDCLTCTRS
jgi:hypothetical protein